MDVTRSRNRQFTCEGLPMFLAIPRSGRLAKQAQEAAELIASDRLDACARFEPVARQCHSEERQLVTVWSLGSRQFNEALAVWQTKSQGIIHAQIVSDGLGDPLRLPGVANSSSLRPNDRAPDAMIALSATAGYWRQSGDCSALRTDKRRRCGEGCRGVVALVSRHPRRSPRQRPSWRHPASTGRPRWSARISRRAGDSRPGGR